MPPLSARLVGVVLLNLKLLKKKAQLEKPLNSLEYQDPEISDSHLQPLSIFTHDMQKNVQR
jgi:hypothetical protein